MYPCVQARTVCLPLADIEEEEELLSRPCAHVTDRCASVGWRQNGTIVDALMLWKADADRVFAGVEPCPVCYSVAHAGDRSLPKVTCRTCRHRFHAACLVRSSWM
jgi:hypothetical protein